MDISELIKGEEARRVKLDELLLDNKEAEKEYKCMSEWVHYLDAKISEIINEPYTGTLSLAEAAFLRAIDTLQLKDESWSVKISVAYSHLYGNIIREKESEFWPYH